jgi:hypothetical protein
MLVNLIATFPAFALNDVGVNFSCPLGSAARGSALPEAAAGAAEELEDDAELEVDAGAEADEELGLLVLFDPPHAATATITAAEVSKTTGSFDTESPFRGLGAADLLATTRTRVRRSVHRTSSRLGWMYPTRRPRRQLFPGGQSARDSDPYDIAAIIGPRGSVRAEAPGCRQRS